MGAPSNPGWKFGYVPSPGEWNNTFGGKADYPVTVAQGGTGGQNTQSANNNLQQRFLVNGGTAIAIQPFSLYGLRTAGGTITITLPPLSLSQDGDWFDILDVDYSAASNPFELICNTGDNLMLWGVTGTSANFNISGTRATVVANRAFWSVSTW